MVSTHRVHQWSRAGSQLRQPDRHSQAAFRPVRQRNLAAMRADHGARDRQAQPRAAGLATAQFLQPHEGLEDPLHIGIGDAGAVVIDHNQQAVRRLADLDPGLISVFHGVADDVPEGALQGEQPA